MTSRRILYIVLLIGSTVMHFAYGQYVTHYILLFMLLLPALSLLISLPSILMSKVTLTGGEDVCRNRPAKVHLNVECSFFLPPERYSIRIESRNLFLDERPDKQKLLLNGKRSEKLVFEPDTSRLGTVSYRIRSARACDYLGLFSIPIRRTGLVALTVLPDKECPIPEPELVEPSDRIMKPKPQGFSEEHELRPYREGDAINLIHWKLSEKYDETIVREPQVLVRKNIVLSVDLPKDYQDQQNVMEQLSYLSDQLTKNNIPYVLHFGMQKCSIGSNGEFERFLKTVLSEPMKEQSAEPVLAGNDTLVYRIVPNPEVRK